MPREHPNVALSRRHFNEVAPVYDDLFVGNMPGYEELHGAILAMLPFEESASFRVLEIGVGSGNLTAAILRRFPRASIVGYDISEEMLALARPKLEFAASRVELRVEDAGVARFDGHFDAAVSAIAVHHVPPRSKPKLFASVFGALRPGGALIIGDTFRAPSAFLEDRYRLLTLMALEQRTVPPEMLDAFRHRSRRSGGSSTRVENYARWLRSAGFVSVDCVWKQLHLAVMFGVRPHAAA